MRRTRLLVTLATLGVLTAVGVNALPSRPTTLPADVDTTYSALTFSMNKWVGPESKPQAEKTPVNGKFERYTVALNKRVTDIKTVKDLNDLRGAVQIALDSVNTGLAPRDLNIMESYFEASLFKQATFELRKVAVTGDGTLQTGKTYEAVVDGTLDLHGIRKDLNGLKVALTPLDHGIVLENRQPLSLASKDFGLDSQVTALLRACGHLGIDEAATLNLKLLLKR
ncbi:YceI-like domain protein [compost metagenome]